MSHLVDGAIPKSIYLIDYVSLSVCTKHIDPGRRLLFEKKKYFGGDVPNIEEHVRKSLLTA